MATTPDTEEIVKANILDGLAFINLAKIYLNRLDNFLSNDDSDSVFLIKLMEDVKLIAQKYEDK